MNSFISNVGIYTGIDRRELKIEPGQYVACVYEGSWWIEIICEVSEEQKDAYVTFMHPHGPKEVFHWPSTQDCFWVPEQHILMTIPAPNTTATGRKYTLPAKTISKLEKLFEKIN